jgi:predicted transcriptional regulator
MAESAKVHDADGRLMPSVVAVPIADATLEAGKQTLENDENRVLRGLHQNPRASFSTIAERCGFMIEGRPSKTKVHRIMANLVRDKLAVKHRGGKFVITEKGEKEIGVGKKDD